MAGRDIHATTGRDGARRLYRQFAQAGLAILVAVTAVVVGGLFWATQRSDDVSVQRQARIAEHAIQVALDDIALQQETVAVWDESAQRMVAPAKDQQWLLDNVGLWLFHIFHHDESILLNDRDQLVQLVVDGRRAPSGHFASIRSDLEPVIASARGRGGRSNGVHDRHPGQPLAPGSSVRTTSRATHDTQLRLVGGRPAAVSAMLMQPSTPGYVGVRRNWPVLVSIRYLDSGFMRDLESTHLIGRPRFSRTAQASNGEHALPLRSDSNQSLGYLIWTPELPGSRIVAVLLPANILAVVLLALLILALMLRFRQSLRERGDLEDDSRYLAYHDSLTGLPNRTFFHRGLEKSLASTPAPALALLLIDIDRFKHVNDSLGHLAGDQLICRVAERLATVVRGDDMVARLGGDEFAVILTGNATPEAVSTVSQTILGQFAEPFELMGSSIHTSASIGAACVGEESIGGTELLRRADVALYRSKAEGRRCARLFDPRMDEEAQRRASVEVELRAAVAKRQFTLWSQPQVTSAGRIAGHELLLHWEHPTLGTISPDQIIPIAEETGLILPIGEWVFDQALIIAAAGNSDQFIALNLSPVQLKTEAFAEGAIAKCRRAKVDPARIELEITEQSLLDDSRAIRASLERLREAGFRIALDDFGTGYSSLNYLRRFTVDKLKIDRGFVAGISGSAEARAIVAAIVSLGQAFGLTVAAEGVETEAQRELLVVAGCDLFQGHYFARATPLEQSDGEGPVHVSLTL